MYKIILTDEVENFLTELNGLATRDKLARGLLKKIFYCIERLKKDGTRVGEPITKHINGNPPREIETAERRMEEYKNKYKEESEKE